MVVDNLDGKMCLLLGLVDRERKSHRRGLVLIYTFDGEM